MVSCNEKILPKLILIEPTFYLPDHSTLYKQKRLFLPGLTLPYLAALVPPHWDVKILIEVIDKIDLDEECDLVGIGTMGHAVFRARELGDEFRKRGKKVFMGGIMATLMPDLVKNHCDSVITGDAEIALPTLVSDYEISGQIRPNYDQQVNNIQNLPLPRYDLLTAKKIGFILPVHATRGCPNNCNFCSIACRYQGVHQLRQIQEIVHDVSYVRSLGFKRFFLVDNNIYGTPEFFREFCEALIPMKMKWSANTTLDIAHNENDLDLAIKAGCEWFSLGIESNQQKGLDSLDKSWFRVDQSSYLLDRIRKAGISISAEMILGIDGDSSETLMDYQVFLDKNRAITLPIMHILIPIPGTKMYESLEKENRILDKDLRKYTGSVCVHKPRDISREKLEETYWEIYRRVYSIPNILKRTLFTGGKSKTLALRIYAFFLNLQYRKNIRKGSPTIVT